MTKLNFTFGKSSIIATNGTNTKFTANELRKIFTEKNPTIFFNDSGAYYYFFDFALRVYFPIISVG